MSPRDMLYLKAEMAGYIIHESWGGWLAAFRAERVESNVLLPLFQNIRDEILMVNRLTVQPGIIAGNLAPLGDYEWRAALRLFEETINK